MKRAAVQWGIGRYLYNLDETFVETSATKKDGWKFAKTKDKSFYWKIPDLPKWALPKYAPKSTETHPQGKKIQNPTNVSRDFKKELKDIMTRSDLGAYYENLMPKEREEALPYLAARKKELST